MSFPLPSDFPLRVAVPVVTDEAQLSMNPADIPGFDYSEIDPEVEQPAMNLRYGYMRMAAAQMTLAANNQPMGWALSYPPPSDDRLAGHNASAAAHALGVVRATLCNRSAGAAKPTNKWSKGRRDPLLPRQILVIKDELNIQRLRDRLPRDDDVRHRFESAAFSFETWQGTGHGNCSGLTQAAQDVLMDRHPTTQTSAALLMGDHEVLIVGSIDKAIVARPLAKWPAHLSVCDAWANIACAVPEYPRRFREKMSRWEKEGKLLREGGAWSSPIGDSWMTCPDSVRRIDLCQRYTSSQYRIERCTLSDGEVSSQAEARAETSDQDAAGRRQAFQVVAMKISTGSSGFPVEAVVDHRSSGAIACVPKPPATCAEAAQVRQEFEAAAVHRMHMALEDVPLGAAIEYPTAEDASFAQCNALAAEHTLRAVRAALHDRNLGALKSTNKWSKTQAFPPSHQASGVELEMLRRRLKNEAQVKLSFEFAAKSANAWAGRAVNCGALSDAAQDYLARYFPSLQTTLVSFEADHVAVVVGSFDRKLAARAMRHWPQHLVVCDPWANISCSADKYPECFRDKMKKWGMDGKRLLFEGSDRWQAPTSDSWMRVPESGGLLLIRQGYSSGQSTVEVVRFDGVQDIAGARSTQPL